MPCELIVWHLLPSMRREITKVLVADSQLSQKEVAKILGVTESAISQYLSSKRGDEFKFSPEILEEINKIAIQIKDSDSESIVIEKICSLCNLIKNKGFLCQFHKADDLSLHNCDHCTGELKNET